MSRFHKSFFGLILYFLYTQKIKKPIGKIQWAERLLASCFFAYIPFFDKGFYDIHTAVLA